MKSVAMSGSLRANVGKKDAKALRSEGKVPCVLYGGAEQVMFAVDERAFKDVVYTPDAATVEINLDGGKSYKAILKELQTHPVTDRIVHADFLEVVTGKNVTMNIPVKFEGNAVGVRDGGKLIRKMRKLKVSGPIEKMPQTINLNVTDMKISEAIKVADVKIDGLTMLDIPSMTVVTIRVTRNVVEEPAKTAAAPAAGAAAADAKKPAADAKKK